MFTALLIAAVIGLAVGEVADLPEGPRQSLQSQKDCFKDQDEYTSYCIFPERERKD